MGRAENLDQVAVFGGAGNMGRLTVELFRDFGYPVLVVDPKDPNSPTSAEAISSSGIIFFSVLPIEGIGKIILDNEDLFDERYVVLDNATIKRPLKEAYRRLCARGVSICSTHPLCKHDQPLYGQKALVMPVGDNAFEASSIGKSIYRNAGMKVIDFGFEKHDTLMLAVQIPHIIQRLMGRAFEKMGVDMNFLQGIATANFQLYELSLWRTLVQDPNISAAIVANFNATSEGREIIAKIRESFEEVAGETDKDALATAFRETYANLGGNEIGPVMNETTTAVLERLANLGMRSLTVFTTDDNPGSLARILGPFANRRVNLTAIDSHKTAAGIRFEIGIDPEISRSTLQEVIQGLQKLGCTATEKIL